MVTHPASSLAQDRESSPAETSVLTTMLRLRRQLNDDDDDDEYDCTEAFDAVITTKIRHHLTADQRPFD